MDRIDGKLNSLSDRQERLIMRFADGECGPLARLKAKKLVRRSASARRFLDDLRHTSVFMGGYENDLHKSESGQVDLWKRVEQRIEQEERAAIFLGERRAGVKVDIFKEFFSSSSLAAGLSGGVVAALLLAFVWTPDGAMLPVPESSDAPAGSAPLAQAVSNPAVATQNPVQRSVKLVSQGAPAARQRSMFNSGNIVAETSGVEVDWMRSDGQVRMIQHPESSVPIIWVKKRTQRRIVLRSRALPRRYGQSQSFVGGFAPGGRAVLQSGEMPRRYGSEGVPAVDENLQSLRSEPVPEASFVFNR